MIPPPSRRVSAPIHLPQRGEDLATPLAPIVPVDLHVAFGQVAIDVGMGRASSTMWTCDLTKRYVEINGDYRS